VTTGAATEPSLQGFLREWEARHPEDVVHVRDEVDPDCLSTSMALELEGQGKAPIIVLDRPAGSELPLVANVFASWDRLAEILGTDRHGFNQAWLAAEHRSVEPRIVERGVSQEVVETGEAVDVKSTSPPESSWPTTPIPASGT
jgi:UbiD family decarboxylase